MNILYVTYLLNGLLMIGLPIGLAIFLTRRFHLGWRLWGLGVATFILSQVGHIPFNWGLTRLFQTGVLPHVPEAGRLLFNSVVLGLSAGLWEELMRFFVLRGWASDARSWRKGVLYGAGHGGVEAIITGLLVLVSYASMVAMKNVDLSTMVPAAQLELAQAQINAYWSASWPLSLMGAVERIFAMTCQIALAVMVLQAFTRRQPIWVVLAILWHAVIDAVPVYLMGIWAGMSWRAYAAEGVIGLFALISLGILFALRQPEPPEPVIEAVDPPEPLSPMPAGAQNELSSDKLDQSRFM